MFSEIPPQIIWESLGQSFKEFLEMCCFEFHWTIFVGNFDRNFLRKELPGWSSQDNYEKIPIGHKKNQIFTQELLSFFEFFSDNFFKNFSSSVFFRNYLRTTSILPLAFFWFSSKLPLVTCLRILPGNSFWSIFLWIPQQFVRNCTTVPSKTPVAVSLFLFFHVFTQFPQKKI